MKCLIHIFGLMLTVTVPNFTWASYVNHCLLSAKVLDVKTPTIANVNNQYQDKLVKSQLFINIKVLKAEKHGRADSGCQTFVNQTMKIKIEHPLPVTLRKGQIIEIESITKDAFPREGYDTTYLLKTN